MKIGFNLFIVVLLLLGTLSFAHNLSPDVYSFLESYNIYKESKYPTRKSILSKYSLNSNNGNDFVDLLVEFDGSEGDLERYVLKRFPGVRKFCIVRMPINDVLTITNKPFVRYATVSKKVKLFLDKVREKLNLKMVYNYYGQDTVQGKGVVVGVVDTGVDASFEDFRTPSGGSRILYLLDQTVSNSNPLWGYGVEYNKNDIERDFSVATDEEGHGTHVLGIAVGNGRLSNGKYMGVAPGSDIIVVKTDFSISSILTGIEYVLYNAKKLGKPAVVNLSIGGNTGSHDGKDIESQILQQIIDYYGRKGNVIVLAGGNSGYYNQHYSDTISTIPISATIRITNIKNDLDSVIFDFWTSYAQDLQVRINTPGGYSSGWISISNDYNSVISSSDGLIQVVAVSNKYNGDMNIQIVLFDTSTTKISSGNWVVSFRKTAGSSVVHGWIDFTDGVFGEFVNGDNDYTLNSLFLLDDVIVVSAYTTKSSFSSPLGEVNISYLTNDNIAYFSSKGPTRDGRQKPDISSPGAIVFAPLSSQYKGYDAKYLDKDYNMYVGMMGTSMATPVVSGICSILLSIDSTLTSQDIINYLKTYSEVSIYDSNGKSWDKNWGWGQVSVKALVETLKNPETLVWFSGNVIRLDNLNNSTTLNIRLSDGNDNISVSIYDMDGNLMKSLGNFSLDIGFNSIPIIVDKKFKTGVYLVKISGSRINTTLKMVVIR